MACVAARLGPRPYGGEVGVGTPMTAPVPLSTSGRKVRLELCGLIRGESLADRLSEGGGFGVGLVFISWVQETPDRRLLGA